MEKFKGLYSVKEGEQTPATVWLERDRINITIRDLSGTERQIYWPFDLLITEQVWKEGRAMVRTQGYPPQSLEVPSRAFADLLENRWKTRKNTWAKRTLRDNSMGLVKILLLFLGILVATYLWIVPFLADRMARRVPVSYEESLGDGLFNTMKSGFKTDERKTAYINEFFRELKIPTKYQIRITVVKENMANAFAMPGGHIVVYDKIIRQMNNYEDLAALLTHEFTHVNNKHTTRSLFRKLGSSIFLSVVVGDAGAISNILFRNADNLKDLNYSRSLEKEADLNGLQLLSERKIDCNGFVRLFTLLQQEMETTDITKPEWTNSHPDLKRRIKYVRNDKHFNRNGTQENEVLKALFGKLKE